MKILVCHNRYRSDFPSGENRYVDYELALLRDAGIDVTLMMEESDSIINGGPLQMANAGLGLLYSPTGVRRFQRLLREERPDVVYIHNVFPLISPAVIRIMRRPSARLSSKRFTTMYILVYADSNISATAAGVRSALGTGSRSPPFSTGATGDHAPFLWCGHFPIARTVVPGVW